MAVRIAQGSLVRKTCYRATSPLQSARQAGLIGSRSAESPGLSQAFVAIGVLISAIPPEFKCFDMPLSVDPTSSEAYACSGNRQPLIGVDY